MQGKNVLVQQAGASKATTTDAATAATALIHKYDLQSVEVAMMNSTTYTE